MKINTAYLFILILFSASCQKDMVHSSNDQSTPTDTFDYAEDERQFIADETEGDHENDYTSDTATPMKVTAVYCYDSIEPINPTTLKRTNTLNVPISEQVKKHVSHLQDTDLSRNQIHRKCWVSSQKIKTQ